MEKIRNFCIIAHIDHGKSTLADRMLEITHTIESRKMKDQVLDSMELERERGITIKMQPVRMVYGDYILNLIDTPGHIDFSYEVSRALSAVEGVVLLIDSTQGVQAQTLSVLEMAKNENLKIIPCLSKVDSPLARIDDVKNEIISVLGCEEKDIIMTSGKTGEGVKELLDSIVARVPPPNNPLNPPYIKGEIKTETLKALVFDFKYSTHKGIVVFIRVVEGSVRAREELLFLGASQKFTSLEVGFFSPEEKKSECIMAGEIGYIVTGIKHPGVVFVGDTITKESNPAEPLGGFANPKPVVWASVFPENQNDLTVLRQALATLKLTDSSLFYEEEASSVLGKGFRVGFLGMLHLEIITERLNREFGLELIITQPSITYSVFNKKNNTGIPEKIFSPTFFPDDGEIAYVKEPWIKGKIILPREGVGTLLPFLYEYEAEVEDSNNFGDTERSILRIKMPLRELMRGFFDKLKSVSKGYASFSYEEDFEKDAEVAKLSVLISGEEEPSLSRVVAKRNVEREAENLVEKLFRLLPRQMFEIKIQAKALGRIIASRTLSAFRKDVTQHMYGGDITRKMKLREKQKKGKKKMKERGRISIPHDVFVKLMRPE